MCCGRGSQDMNIPERKPSGLSVVDAVPGRLGATLGDLGGAAEARLSGTYEHVGAGIVEIDERGQILNVNQQFCVLTGYSASELAGKTIFEETLPEDVAQDRDQFRRQVGGEIDRYTIEKRIHRKGGGHFWASVTSS